MTGHHGTETSVVRTEEHGAMKRNCVLGGLEERKGTKAEKVKGSLAAPQAGRHGATVWELGQPRLPSQARRERSAPTLPVVT